MRITKIKVATLLVAGCLLTSSCVGSFMLTRKLAEWNTRATGDKFLNEIIFIFLIVPYGVTITADALVINTMEFWSGSNPLAKNVGKTRQVMGQDGRYYAVTTLRNGYKVKSPDGEITKFIYDKKTDSWSQQSKGKPREIFRFNSDGTIRACLPNGGTIDITPDEAGVFRARMAVSGANFWAMR